MFCLTVLLPFLAQLVVAAFQAFLAEAVAWDARILLMPHLHMQFILIALTHPEHI